jgi:hypothetical protein
VVVIGGLEMVSGRGKKEYAKAGRPGGALKTHPRSDHPPGVARDSSGVDHRPHGSVGAAGRPDPSRPAAGHGAGAAA